MDKKQIQIGNDGYGYPNITITKEDNGISIVKTDPHNYGRVSESMWLRDELIDDLIIFLIEVKQQKY